MDDVKVRLTIILPGSVMVSQQEAENKPELNNKHKMFINEKNKQRLILFSTRKCKNAKQVINITTESYKDMISATECPAWMKAKQWKSMKKNDRLEAHLKQTCEYIGGISYTYEVLDD